jgi:hypothetical protein
VEGGARGALRGSGRQARLAGKPAASPPAPPFRSAALRPEAGADVVLVKNPSFNPAI